MEVRSDVVRPWCCIGERRVEAALDRFPHRDEVEVVRRSCRLDPSIPEGEVPRHDPAAGVSGNTPPAQEQSRSA